MVFSIGLVSIAMYDVINIRRTSGDPTTSVNDVAVSSATTINNPGYRESGGSGENEKEKFLFEISIFIPKYNSLPNQKLRF